MTPNIQQSLSILLQGLTQYSVETGAIVVTQLSMDSRDIESDSLFIATASDKVQRDRHIEQAIARGAVAVLIEANSMREDFSEWLAVIEVKALSSKVSEIASRFYNHPSDSLTVIAVTGTNGKTSVVQYLAQCVELMGQPCGVIGTLGIGRHNQVNYTGMTTPNPIVIQAALAGFNQQSIKIVVLEASSHALKQDRLKAVNIDVAVLTHISRDHLDYHRTMADYAEAKKRLFFEHGADLAVLNINDPYGEQWSQELAAREKFKVWRYGSDSNNSEMTSKNRRPDPSGVSFELVFGDRSEVITSPLLGDFNIENLVTTACCLVAMGFDFDKVSSALSQCRSAKGRMQLLTDTHKANVIIDFAHTPDALSKALQASRLHVKENGKLWCIFGCGGERDQGKRPMMAKAAEQLADQIVLTADNPRHEDNQQIVDTLLLAMSETEKVHVEHDRHRAIEFSIEKANESDLILVAGKGHETYQEIAGIRYPFDDTDAVKTAFRRVSDPAKQFLENQ